MIKLSFNYDTVLDVSVTLGHLMPLWWSDLTSAGHTKHQFLKWRETLVTASSLTVPCCHSVRTQRNTEKSQSDSFWPTTKRRICTNQNTLERRMSVSQQSPILKWRFTRKISDAPSWLSHTLLRHRPPAERPPPFSDREVTSYRQQKNWSPPRSLLSVFTQMLAMFTKGALCRKTSTRSWRACCIRLISH